MVDYKYKVTGPRGGKYLTTTLAEAKSLTTNGGHYHLFRDKPAKAPAWQGYEVPEDEMPRRGPYGRRRNPDFSDFHWTDTGMTGAFWKQDSEGGWSITVGRGGTLHIIKEEGTGGHWATTYTDPDGHAYLMGHLAPAPMQIAKKRALEGWQEWRREEEAFKRGTHGSQIMADAEKGRYSAWARDLSNTELYHYWAAAYDKRHHTPRDITKWHLLDAEIEHRKKRNPAGSRIVWEKMSAGLYLGYSGSHLFSVLRAKPHQWYATARYNINGEIVPFGAFPSWHEAKQELGSWEETRRAGSSGSDLPPAWPQRRRNPGGKPDLSAIPTETLASYMEMLQSSHHVNRGAYTASEREGAKVIGDELRRRGHSTPGFARRNPEIF